MHVEVVLIYPFKKVSYWIPVGQGEKTKPADRLSGDPIELNSQLSKDSAV